MFNFALFKYLTKNTLNQPLLHRNYAKISYNPINRCMSNHKTREISALDSNLTSLATQPEFAVNQSNETEQQFLVKLKNNPDVFGESSTTRHDDDIALDAGDISETKYFEEQPSPAQRLRIKQYADIIKPLLAKKKIKEALDVVEVRMLKEDRVKPNNYIYNLLLGGLGRVGYTKKAFALYNQMKKRGLLATGGTYTALFNACANSPWTEDGLTRAKHLRAIMVEKMYEPNDTNYHAMIKAFGRCGDTQTAFDLVDEMVARKMPIGDDTINFLLQACISDKDAGFRHALLVWRKLVRKRIRPTLFTYNLLLKSIRDCGIGDVTVMNDVLNTILNETSRKQLNPPVGQIDSTTTTKLLSVASDKTIAETSLPALTSNTLIETTSVVDQCRPNLLAKTPHLGNIISLLEIKEPHDRLLLVGGFKGFLSNMHENNCTPDIKTFTILLDTIPHTLTAEKDLMIAMKQLQVRPDVDFFNMLIKKRSMRFDYHSAKDVLSEMERFDFRPNLMTYGVLALGCKTKDQALELLDEMRQHFYTINIEILGAMLHQACYHNNFSYVLELMEICLRDQISPSKLFMEHLGKFKSKCKQMSNDQNDALGQSASFQKGFAIFRMRLKVWREQVQIDETENEHPWTQFRQSTETDVTRYKDKDVRFKARHTSLFRVKTSTKHRPSSKQYK